MDNIIMDCDMWKLINTNFLFILVADLIPLKEKLDQINRECFFNDNIDFNRFEVIGQESDSKMYAVM